LHALLSAPDLWFTGEVFKGELLTDDFLEGRRVKRERGKGDEASLPRLCRVYLLNCF